MIGRGEQVQQAGPERAPAPMARMRERRTSEKKQAYCRSVHKTPSVSMNWITASSP